MITLHLDLPHDSSLDFHELLVAMSEMLADTLLVDAVRLSPRDEERTTRQLAAVNILRGQIAKQQEQIKSRSRKEKGESLVRRAAIIARGRAITTARALQSRRAS